MNYGYFNVLPSKFEVNAGLRSKSWSDSLGEYQALFTFKKWIPSLKRDWIMAEVEANGKNWDKN